LIHQSQIHFIDQRRGLQRVPRRLTSHKDHGSPVEFLIDQWQELIKRGLIPITPIRKQPCDSVRLDLSHINISMFFWVRRAHYKSPPALLHSKLRGKEAKKNIFELLPFFHLVSALKSERGYAPKP